MSDKPNIFKSGSTVPVKFRRADSSCNSAGTATITYQLITDGIPGPEIEPVSTSAANAGNTFRTGNEGGFHIFNLNTDGMDTGTYLLNVRPGDGTVNTVKITLK